MFTGNENWYKKLGLCCVGHIGGEILLLHSLTGEKGSTHAFFIDNVHAEKN